MKGIEIIKRGADNGVATFSYDANGNAVTDSGGNPAVNVVSESKYASGEAVNKGIEALASTSAASREWAAGSRPEYIIVTAKPSDPATTEIVRANARVNLVFDAISDAVGEALAAPAVGSGVLPYEEIGLNEPTEFIFPKTDTYDGLSRISVYSNGASVDIIIRAVK